VFGVILSSCNATLPPATNDDRPEVVATSTILTDWAQQIGGDEVNVVGLLKPGTDPHVYEPVPQDSVALENADLILYNGYDLEPGLIRIINATAIQGQKLAVGEVVQPLQLSEGEKTAPDPHVWGDAERAIAMVEAIHDALIELSPGDRDEFTQNMEEFVTELVALDRWIGEQIATIPENRRQLVTTHDAFQYYAQAYGLTVAGTLIGISTEEQPSAQTVQKLSDAIKRLNVPTIFAETTINPQLITTVAQEANVKLAEPALYSDSLGAPDSDGDTYVNMMVANTRAIVENLGGQYTPFSRP
jgi:manganese/iron transport system substrate-binding protein